jgi:hypothetical protein
MSGGRRRRFHGHRRVGRADRVHPPIRTRRRINRTPVAHVEGVRILDARPVFEGHLEVGFRHPVFVPALDHDVMVGIEFSIFRSE